MSHYYYNTKNSLRNPNFFETEAGKKAYDDEIKRIQENRKIYNQYVKLCYINQKELLKRMNPGDY